MTRSTCPEQLLTTRQIRCLQGVCKCSGAGVSHLVVSEIQLDEGGIRLVIFHSTHVSAQVAARVLSHTTAPVRSKFCLQGYACEGARNLCATARPVGCTRTCPLSPLKKT